MYLKPAFTYVGSLFFASNVLNKARDISVADLDHVTLCTSLNHNWSFIT